jgi:hypothetical protein
VTNARGAFRSFGRAAAVALLAAACAGPPSPPPVATLGATSDGPSGSPRGADPPAAVLIVSGAERHEGELGTYVYRGAGSDAPWLPARTLASVPVRSSDRLSVALVDGGVIGPWAATIAPAGDDQAERGRGLAADETAGGLRESVELPVPPRGGWVLMVRLDYGDGSGSGAYFWLVEVG